jgi:hypothetical protein
VFTRITVMESVHDDIFLPIGEECSLQMEDVVDELGLDEGDASDVEAPDEMLLDETDASDVAAPVAEPVNASIVAYAVAKVIADLLEKLGQRSETPKTKRRKSMRVVKYHKGKPKTPAKGKPNTPAKGKPKAPAKGKRKAPNIELYTGLLCDEDMNHMTEPVKSRLYSQQMIDEMEIYYQTIVNSQKERSVYISTIGASAFEDLQARTGLDPKSIKQWLRVRPVRGVVSGRECAPRMRTPLVLSTPVARKFQVIHVIQ